MHASDHDALRARRFKSTRTIAALMLREMSSTYGKSPGGYFWAVMEPVAAVAMLSLAFQLFFRSPSLGTNFPLYFATGYLPFSMSLDIANKVSRSITFSRSLLAYPAVRYSDALFARMLLSLMTHISIGAMVLSGVHLYFGLSSIVDPVAVIMAVVMAAAVGMGIGTFNCYMFNAIPMWERVWQIITRPLLLVSGVIFLYDQMPVMARDILWYNPLTHVVGMMRRGFYVTYDAPYISVAFVLGVSMLLLAFGLMLLHRHHKDLIYG